MGSYDEALDHRLRDHDRKRQELIAAATKGVREHLQTTRGAHDFRNAKIVTTDKGFCVQFGEDNRIYFDTISM